MYDALYDLPTDKESYCIAMDYNTMNCLETAYASDLIVPYININSDDAKIANQEIYELYEELIDIFNENSDYGVWFTERRLYTRINVRNKNLYLSLTAKNAGVMVSLIIMVIKACKRAKQLKTLLKEKEFRSQMMLGANLF